MKTNLVSIGSFVWSCVCVFVFACVAWRSCGIDCIFRALQGKTDSKYSKNFMFMYFCATHSAKLIMPQVWIGQKVCKKCEWFRLRKSPNVNLYSELCDAVWSVEYSALCIFTFYARVVHSTMTQKSN